MNASPQSPNDSSCAPSSRAHVSDYSKFFTTFQKSFTRPDINIGVDHKIHETVVQSVVSKGAEEKVIPLTEENGHKRCHGNRSIHQRRSHGYAKQCCLEARE